MFKDFEEKRPLEIRQLQSKEIFFGLFQGSADDCRI